MKSLWLCLVLIGSAIVGAACVEQGSGSLRADKLVVADCSSGGYWEPFELELTFMALLRAQDALIIRMSTSSQLSEESDSLVVTLENYSAVKAALLAEGSVVIALDSVHAAASVALLKSCPQSTLSLFAVKGELRLDALGTLSGERVSGGLTFDLIEGRSGEELSSGVEVDFDFRVYTGTPHEAFADIPARYGE